MTEGAEKRRNRTPREWIRMGVFSSASVALVVPDAIITTKDVIADVADNGKLLINAVIGEMKYRLKFSGIPGFRSPNLILRRKHQNQGSWG